MASRLKRLLNKNDPARNNPEAGIKLKSLVHVMNAVGRNQPGTSKAADSIIVQFNEPIESDKDDINADVLKPPAYESVNVAPASGFQNLLNSLAASGKLNLPASSHEPESMPQSDSKTNPDNVDSIQTSPNDDFEKLRQDREAARVARQMEKIQRGMATHQGIVSQIELEELLTGAVASSRTSSGVTTPTAEAK